MQIAMEIPRAYSGIPQIVGKFPDLSVSYVRFGAQLQ